MPTYLYYCENQFCNHEWEEDQKMSDPVITECTQCKQETAKRGIAATNFALIGGGWASEGYSKK